MTVSSEHNTPFEPPDSRPPSGPSSEKSRASPPSDQDEVAGGRVALVEAELTRERGSRLRVRVALSRGGHVVEKELNGVGDEVIELRLAAEATITALDQLIHRPGYFKLVGIKHLHAFDSPVVLVCVRTGPGFTKKLIGCVPAPETLHHGVAMAVLHATNRLVEAMGDPEEREAAGQESDPDADQAAGQEPDDNPSADADPTSESGGNP